MTSCTFAGHREVYQSGIDDEIKSSIDSMLRTDSEFIFYTGGMGDFDRKCASAVRAAKHTHPDKTISLALVLPYMTNRLNTDKSFYEYYYDEIIIPSELCGIHYKAAIKMRNRWMVDNADFILSYVFREFGGAFETVKYAQRQNKIVINLASKK